MQTDRKKYLIELLNRFQDDSWAKERYLAEANSYSDPKVEEMIWILEDHFRREELIAQWRWEEVSSEIAEEKNQQASKQHANLAEEEKAEAGQEQQRMAELLRKLEEV